MKYVDVILPLPLEGLFTYSLPADLQDRNLFGFRLLVPLGKSKTYTALAVKCHDNEPEFEVRDIMGVLDEHPMLTEEQYKLWSWIAEYYMSPIGDVYKAALPSGLKAEDNYRPRTETYVSLAQKFRSEQALNVAMDMLGRAEKQRQTFSEYLAMSGWDTLEGDTPKEEIREITREELINAAHSSAPIVKALCTRGLLKVYELEVGRLGDAGEPHPEKIKKLNEAQQEAYNKVLMQFMKKPVVLLHGVTSSGKTELYIHLIQQAIDRGEQVLYLLPEIALTVQIMQRLQRVFGNRLGIYHSKYSDAERVEIWQKQLSENPYQVILGARSAVFLPFRKLGLVIIDEEHESSFKQQDPAPRYHARSAAIVLAQMFKAKTLLGTATPSMESYRNAMTGKYGFVELTTRYKGLQLPDIEIVDIKDLRRRKMMTGAFSPQLIKAIRNALANNQQVILFQNRRGFSLMVECKECGWVPHCTNCDVPLVYHKTFNVLTCHYCGCTYPVPTQCPSCFGKDIINRGFGTEKIEDELMTLFPEAKVARMDLDTTRTRNAYDRIINDFSAGKTDVLIGTQMVTKGLDFDRVAVVGILNADTMLNKPDFRAYEQAFQMMSQVSGRAGRKGSRGKVFLQTRNAALPLLRQVVNNDYRGLYEEMCEERNFFRYPPFSHIINVIIKHSKDYVAEGAAQVLSGRLRQWLGDRVLGPDKPSVARVKSQHIRKIVLKIENKLSLTQVRQCLRQAQAATLQDKRYAAVVIYYDVDPL
jgi:primosomal protein N' (replication factor Y)